ncbi:hypothetical protein JZ751_005388 [Albula glossodonta]|uniref:Uncharacterized protein n=1 Tax=Albula glossodonta TaxID=121402 RepID=A0A8T2MUR1_9TELE|nr:hypothetical protein JZ751_005388 [Albula glossodonta]
MAVSAINEASMSSIGMRNRNREKWEKDVRAASSLDELLKLTDFPDWKLWKCRLKLKHMDPPPPHPEYRSLSSSSSSSSSSASSHRSTRYAATSYSLEILKVLLQSVTQTHFASPQLLTVIPFKHGPEPVLIQVANHTACALLCQRPRAHTGCVPVA